MRNDEHASVLIPILMCAAVILSVLFSANPKVLNAETCIAMKYEESLFNRDEILRVNIELSDEDWVAMLADPISETWYECSVTINGTTLHHVGVRTKGNTSLSQVAADPNSDRYSLKLEFDHYVKGQTFDGLDKLCLNNGYADNSYMKEALIYDMFAYVGASASLYNFASVYVNGENRGLYLALEAVEDSFMLRTQGVSNGELYKPENLGNGGNRNGGNEQPQIENANGMQWPQMRNNPENDKFEKPEGAVDDLNDLPENAQAMQPGNRPPMMDGNGENSENSADETTGATAAENEMKNDRMEVRPGMDGENAKGSQGGSDLNYIDDDLDSYSSIWEGEVTSSGKQDHKRVITALKNIFEGNDLTSYMNVDNLLKYAAVHVFSVNDDSLSGSMAHNYYLYESNGKLDMFPWDYNLSFGGMKGQSGNATSVINSPIDDPFNATDFFDTLLEQYGDEYYEQLLQTVEYVESGRFEEFYTKVRSQIDDLVKEDPTAFCTYEEYEAACETLKVCVNRRAESIKGQIGGTIPSNSQEQRIDSSSLIDGSELDLSLLGSMNMGNGGNKENRFDMNNAFDDNTQAAPSGFQGMDNNEGMNNHFGMSTPVNKTENEDSSALNSNIMVSAIILAVSLLSVVLIRRK